MAKTIIFKPEFEQKLKELKIKTKFVNNLKVYCKRNNYSLATRIAEVNNQDTFGEFVSGAFIWANTPKDEGCEFWYKIAYWS